MSDLRLGSKIGVCGRCVRLSVYVAVIWCALTWLSWSKGLTFWLIPEAIISACFGILAMAHVAALAVRVGIAAARSNRPIHVPRRRAIARIARAVASALAFILLPTAFARAERGCREGKAPCGNTGKCCSPGWYYCDYCDANGKRNKCVPPDDDALALARSCCNVLVQCG